MRCGEKYHFGRLRNRLFCLVLLLVVILLASGRRAGAAFQTEPGKMVFSLNYTGEAPEINALFRDRGERIELRLPATGLKTPIQESSLDDEWITGYGLEDEAGKRVWYLRKRRPGLEVKPLLALERQGTELKIVLLKSYRRWSPSSSAAVPAAAKPVAADVEADKLARVQALLSEADAPPATAGKPATAKKTVSQPSLMAAAWRSFAALVILVLVICGLALVFKRWRRGRGGLGHGRLVRVLGVEALVGRYQIALFELGSRILVVGLCGDNMTLLTTISDPAEIEEFRLLQEEGTLTRGFGGALQSLLSRETGESPMAQPVPESEWGESGSKPETETVDSGGSRRQSSEAVYQRPVAGRVQTPTEALPENYRDVVSQIKSRLRRGESRS